MGLFSWLWRKRGPQVVEVPTIEAEYVYIKRLTCRRCGRPVQSQRHGHGDGPNGRTHDFWTINCAPCKSSYELILSVPRGAAMDMLAGAIREKGDTSPQAQALLNLFQLLKDAGQPTPPPPPKKAENRNFLDDFIEKADTVRDREVRDAQAARTDPAIRQRMIEQARQKHQARLQAALALCEKAADASLPPEESARLQYTFISIELPAVEADCRRLGIG